MESVNYSVNSNMYEVNATDVLEAYGEFIDGSPRAVVLAISRRPLPPRAADALRASCASFGYDAEAIAWLTLESTDAAFKDMLLGAPETMNIVEGLDPLIMVAADEDSVEALRTAYHRDIPLNAATRLLGRPLAAFRDFPAMLKDERTKQEAWSSLKQLF